MIRREAGVRKVVGMNGTEAGAEVPDGEAPTVKP